MMNSMYFKRQDKNKYKYENITNQQYMEIWATDLLGNTLLFKLPEAVNWIYANITYNRMDTYSCTHKRKIKKAKRKTLFYLVFCIIGFQGKISIYALRAILCFELYGVSIFALKNIKNQLKLLYCLWCTRN